MKRTTVLLISVLACVATLGILFFTSGRQKNVIDGANGKAAISANEQPALHGDAQLIAQTRVQQPAQKSQQEQNVERVKSTITKLSKRAQEGIVIADYTAFLADLEKIVSFDNASAANDLPLLILVDKKHHLPSSYEPVGLIPLVQNSEFNINRNDLSLRPEAYDALRALSRAALADGIKLLVSSTYRSYSYQEKLFQKWVEIDGLEEAERESARAGRSQHQLGTAVDFGSITDDFAETKMGKWVYENAATYGWSLSFPAGYEDVTGYRWECWHFRYIGVEACQFQKRYFSDVQQYMLEFLNAWKNA
ncbi:MAG: M15 family metallopeptidase [Treponema sp.]|nr:M15 family metallopeptidase [Treponema sp.]